jgi:hypothetical protein
MRATVSIPFDTSAPGPFTLPHNLGIVPSTVIFEFTSGGTVWFQPQRFDANNLYLIASDTGIEGIAIVFADCGC